MSVGQLTETRTARSRPAALVAVIADPDEDSARQLATALLEHDVLVTVCADGAEALLQAGLVAPDVLLVSASLPVVDGPTVVAVLRRHRDTPVVVGVAAADATDATDVGRALAAGATACVRKPYRLPELLPLLQSTRSDPPVSDLAVLRRGALELDDTAHEVRYGRTPVVLTPREFDLLRYLMRHSHRVINPRELLDEVWGVGRTGDPSTLTVHINRIRNRLGGAGAPADLIQTLRGVGYRLRCEK